MRQTARSTRAVRKLVDEAYDKAKGTLTARRKDLDEGTALLLQKETKRPPSFRLWRARARLRSCLLRRNKEIGRGFDPALLSSFSLQSRSVQVQGAAAILQAHMRSRAAQ